jgi:hypothetical protein
MYLTILEDGWPKHVGVHCVYKLISVYLCAFIGTIIVYGTFECMDYGS